jgi:hypothetical protein
VHRGVLPHLHGGDRGPGRGARRVRAPAAAAREFFLAARAVIDVRGDHVSGVEKSPNGSKDFERIEIS